MGEVDEIFIQAVEHRPNLSVTEAEGIPIIDLSALTNPSSSNIDNLVSEIGDACKSWGFFMVTNHGVPLETRQNMESVARKFFALPLEEKRKVSRDKKMILGYYDGEYTKNVRDWKEVFDYSVPNSLSLPLPAPDDNVIIEYHSQWPDYPPEFREACEEYAKELEKLAYKLMEIIALSLGLPANRFESFFTENTSFVRINYYPPCPFPHLALGSGRHKDGGIITILAEDDVRGLEIRRETDGEWVLVNSTPDAFIINVGDILQVWTNDMYKSMEHRVKLNSGKDRLSFPFFLDPAHYTMVQPLDELVNELNPAKYKAYNWGLFFATRRLSNFMKLEVDNLQISEFKLQ